MNNNGRVLTLRVTIMDSDAADWVWKAHPEPIHGLIVSAISNGDMFAERDRLAAAAVFYIKEGDETTEQAIAGHFGGGYDTIEDAANEAKTTVPPGESWEIIDRHGNVLSNGQKKGTP